MNSFKETLNYPSVNFFGNVQMGDALHLSDLRCTHDAVVICTGTSQPRMLGIPGESLRNSLNSAQFVGWYNDAPEHTNLDISLKSVRRVAVIGHGNVALDVARILLKPWRSLQNTEISKHALRGLSEAKIEHVDIIGRRGPLQVKTFNILQLFSLLLLDVVYD